MLSRAHTPTGALSAVAEAGGAGMNRALLDASKLMMEAWSWLPYWIVIDLTLYHLYLRRVTGE